MKSGVFGAGKLENEVNYQKFECLKVEKSEIFEFSKNANKRSDFRTRGFSGPGNSKMVNYQIFESLKIEK